MTLTKELNQFLELTSGSGTNPLFNRQLADSVKLGTRKMVAKIILQNKNPKWAFCRRHYVIVSWQSERKGWTDWAGDVHGDINDPANQCYLVNIPPEDIATLDGKVGEMLSSLRHTATKLTEAIDSKRKADLEEQYREEQYARRRIQILE
jgi:hypothetical protein